jgi:hypothetical protein
MLKKEKTGQYAEDIKTGKIFELETEVEYDILAATFSFIYLIASLIFFCWLLLDISIGNHSLLTKIFPLFTKVEKNSIFNLILYTTIGGGLGGVLNGIRSIISWHAERRAFGWRFVWKYITLPLRGFVLAGVVFAIIRGGVGAFGGSVAESDGFTTQAMSAFGVGALAGYGSHKVFIWLDSLVNKLFKVAKVPKVKVPDLTGKTKEEAETVLKKSNLIIGEVNQEPTEDQTKIGKIIDQKPSKDSMIAKAASVDITIATKKE